MALTLKASLSNGSSKQAEIKELPKFLAHFRRGSGYEGEYGFDWLEWNYETEKIEKIGISALTDIKRIYDSTTDRHFEYPSTEKVQEILERLYPVTTIWDKKYFVPYLSIFPGKRVEMQLVFKDIVKEKDHITFNVPDGLSVYCKGQKNESIDIELPTELPADIAIVCDKELSDNMRIEVLNNKKKVIGLLEVIKNNCIKQVEINYVYVAHNEEDVKTLKEARIADRSDVWNELNHYFHQGLVNVCKYNTSHNELFIDNSLRQSISGDIGFLGRVKKCYYAKYPLEKNKTHINVFLYQEQLLGSSGNKTNGLADTWIVGDMACIISKDYILMPGTHVHEILHALGLTHVFAKDSDKEGLDNYYMEEKVKINDLIKKNEEIIKTSKDPLVIKEAKEINERYSEYLIDLDIKRKIRTDNILGLKEQFTDNMMDYSPIRKSLFSYQWKIINENIKS